MMSHWTYVTLQIAITLGVVLCRSENDSDITIEKFKFSGTSNITEASSLGGEFQQLNIYAKSRLHCLMTCTLYQSCFSVIVNREGGECQLVFSTGLVESTLLRVTIPMYTKLSRLQDDIVENVVTPTLLSSTTPETSNFTIVLQECRRITSTEVKYIELSPFSTPLKVRCSAWGIYIQESHDDETDFFNRSMTEFQKGFGNVSRNGEKYILGLDDIHLLTSSLTFSLAIKPINAGSFKLSDFKMANSSMNYRITFSKCSRFPSFYEICDQAMLDLNGTMFSTYDADHDGNSIRNCANETGGGFWYSADCNDWDFYISVDGYLTTRSIDSMVLV